MNGDLDGAAVDFLSQRLETEDPFYKEWFVDTVNGNFRREIVANLLETASWDDIGWNGKLARRSSLRLASVITRIRRGEGREGASWPSLVPRLSDCKLQDKPSLCPPPPDRDRDSNYS